MVNITMLCYVDLMTYNTWVESLLLMLKYQLEQERKSKRALYRKLRRYKRIAYYARKTGQNLLETFKQGSEASKSMFGETWDKVKGDRSTAQYAARKGLSYYGPGDYWQDIQGLGRQYVPKGSFAYAGRYLGGLTGVPGADAVGAYMGNKLSNYVGFGDYSNNQIAGGNGTQISVNRSDYTGDIYVARTEFVSNVTATISANGISPFEVRTFALNPGLQGTFPWLSQVAQNFTLYEFRGLMFQYKPLFSENAGSSNSLGKVILATEYDPNAIAFRTSVEMENYDYAHACKPSDGLVHGVETLNSQQALNLQYVRTGATTRDKIFTDIGILELGTEGIPGNANSEVIIGELWVTYNIKLSRAELYNSLLGNGIGFDLLQGSCDANQMMYPESYTFSANNIGVTVSSVSPTTALITFPSTVDLGYYIITCYISTSIGGAQTQFTNPGLTSLCEYFQIPGTLPTSVPVSNRRAPSVAGVTNSTLMDQFGLYVNSPGLAQAQVELNLVSALSASGQYTLTVHQISQNAALTAL